MLAGISVDYVIRLEQGRADRPSEQVVTAIARTLQLTADERDQLFIAAGLPVPLPTQVPTRVPASVQRLIARLGDVAIGVFSADWTLLTANDAFTALHGPFEDGRERNLLWRHFVLGSSRLVPNAATTDRFERAMVSDLRTATILYPKDGTLRHLVRELSASSAAFAKRWSTVEAAHHRTEHKLLDHPAVGRIALDCDVLTVEGSGLHIVTQTAEPGSEDASKYDLVRTLGATALP